MAYIGPGAGFAFLGSFLVLFVAIILAAVSVLTFPLRAVAALLFRRKRTLQPQANRVVIVGLDGLDPGVATRMMDRGELPVLAALRKTGTYSPLQTTCPPISPVAWSSFATGTNPGKHNIFDFLSRDLRTYRPELSSSRVTTTARRGLFRGRRSAVELRRKSKTFWAILGEHGVCSTVLRVPITFPPERFRGRLLSGMCVPDLRGTQGSFTLYESRPPTDARPATGGTRVPVTVEDRRVQTVLTGPPSADGSLRVPLEVRFNGASDAATLRVCGQKIRLKTGVSSDWVRVEFGRGLRKVRGICRFLLRSVSPDFSLYVTPINIDPEHPAMPISQPAYYATYLAKLHGPFATLGLAEDTWALSEGAIDEAAFLDQTDAIHREREEMFFEALKRVRRGVCCCVFDATDRIQHMFYGRTDGAGTAIEEVYRRSDALVGRVLKTIDDGTVLFVLSDHGFTGFRRGVNVNAWLAQEGFLAFKPDAAGAEYLAGVDWEKTRAYSFGLAGIYLNVKGRESRGIVDGDQERRALKQEIAARLRRLADPATGQRAVREVYDAAATYRGPYRDNGPDLVVGYEAGYRASWDTAAGKTSTEVFEDNTAAWGGDHCVDRAIVPGVFFCNREVDWRDGPPDIMDLAPTVLHLLGVEKPAHMDGNVLACSIGNSGNQE
ncbi:alkaline phosphatase family protein [bacterium]|nr:alkaline phosphatase family protein [bacterium]